MYTQQKKHFPYKNELKCNEQYKIVDIVEISNFLIRKILEF